MVPTWKKDLDALVTETMAFAASVNEKKLVQPKQVDPLVADRTASEGDAKDEVIQSDAPVLATVEAVLAEQPAALSPLPVAPSPLSEPTTWPARLPPMIVPPSERDEIKQRLATLRLTSSKCRPSARTIIRKRWRGPVQWPLARPLQKTNKRNGYTSPVLI